MKTLLIAEYRAGKLLGNYRELLTFADQCDGESIMFVVGKDDNLPVYPGKLYLADNEQYGEYNPSVHRDLLLKIIGIEQPEMIVFSHSSYGWDLAPRVACALRIAQISEVVAVDGRQMIVPACNSKMRRKVEATGDKCVVTLQAGAFPATEGGTATPRIIPVDIATSSSVTFLGYEEAPKGGVDLSRAEVVVSAGRGIGKPENIGMIAGLAQKLGGEYGASRPVVDAEWAEHNRQVGTTGQTVSPRLYVACGISGAIQHLAGMKKSEFIVAINTDREAPIGEVADVLVVADLKQFIPALMEKL